MGDSKTKTYTKIKALGMVSVSPRDRKAMKMFYKGYEKQHSLKVWLTKFEKDGFDIKNSEELKTTIK